MGKIQYTNTYLTDPSEKTEGEKEEKEHAGTNPFIQIKDKIRRNKRSI
jgi:hypothetical protein